MTMQPTTLTWGAVIKDLSPSVRQLKIKPPTLQDLYKTITASTVAKVSEVIVDLSTIEELGTSYGWLLEELGALQVCT